MKKSLKIFIIILGIMVVLGIVFFTVDYNRVKNNKRPIFCIQNSARVSDGGTVEYFGLGYKVIDFHTLAGFDDIKIGTWFMDYNDFEQEIKEYEKNFEESQKNDETTLKKVSFIRTYKVIADLKKTDQTGEYNYYVIEQYQLEEPIVIKISSKYKLQENVNYEFSFEGKKVEGKEYSIQETFNTFEIVKIEETDKQAMEQIQGEI